MVISVAQGRQCANISITDDSVPQDDELFQVSISSVRRTVGTPRYTLRQRTAIVSIIDDDRKKTLTIFIFDYVYYTFQ